MVRAKEGNKKDELLKAARYLFATQGVSHTPVSHIVNKAGVAQGTFYLYFASKEDVLNKIAEQVADELFQQVISIIDPPSTKAVSKLLKIHTILTQAFEKDKEQENAQVKTRLTDALIAKFKEPLAAILKQGVKEGTFKNSHPEETAMLILYSAKPFIESCDKKFQAKWGDVHLDFILKGLGYKDSFNKLM